MGVHRTGAPSSTPSVPRRLARSRHRPPTPLLRGPPRPQPGAPSGPEHHAMAPPSRPLAPPLSCCQDRVLQVPISSVAAPWKDLVASSSSEPRHPRLLARPAASTAPEAWTPAADATELLCHQNKLPTCGSDHPRLHSPVPGHAPSSFTPDLAPLADFFPLLLCPREVNEDQRGACAR